MRLSLLCLIAALTMAGCTVYRVAECPPSGPYVIVDTTGIHHPTVVIKVGELDGLRIRVWDRYFDGPKHQARVTVQETQDSDMTNRSGWTRKLRVSENGRITRVTVQWPVYPCPYCDPIMRSFDRTIRLGRGVTEETISVDGSPPR